jgi:hypothetical protein
MKYSGRYVVSGFRHEVDEKCALFWVITQRIAVISYRPFVKMGPIICRETSVRNFHYSLRNNPEECSFLFSTESLHAIPEFNLLLIATLTKFWLVCIFPKIPVSVRVKWFWLFGGFRGCEGSYCVCRKNQQNAHFFHQWFNSTILPSTCFELLSVRHQEDCYTKLYGILSCIYISSIVTVRMWVYPHPDSDYTA